jgi:hypothetical protein
MWEELRTLLRELDPVRIENLVGSGVPDVNYNQGWIELKYMDRWPPRGGPLRIDHFTPEQRGWLTRRRKKKGKAFVLLKVGLSEWLLFDGLIAALYLGHEPRERLYEIVVARWTRKPSKEEIQSCLLR